MTRDEVMAKLESLGTEQLRKINLKNGAGENQFGVKMGDLRVMAKEIKANPDLAKELWATGNLEARLLATLLMKPKQLPKEELDRMVREVNYGWLGDWVMTNLAKQHPDKEELRLKWMADKDTMASRAGWSLTTERVGKNPEGLDLSALLDRIEKEMGEALEIKQWCMNFCLIEIGVEFPEHRDRAVAIGEKLGVLRDYPTSKGCVSPYAPIAIPEMVKRK